MAAGKLLVYLLRRDLRVSDNPILHHLAASPDHGYTHLLPIYVFPSRQVEVSGFLKDGQQSPYPQARSRVGGYWRCGPHRAKFVAQSVWDLKDSLQQLDSDLVIRVGDTRDVLSHLMQGLQDQSPKLAAVWMTEELPWEEKEEHEAVAALCSENDVDFKLWPDEKYYIDDRDTGLAKPADLPDVFTTYRKSQEPLRERPRKALPAPAKALLPPMPDESAIPPQHGPFEIPASLDGLEARLLQPLDIGLSNPPKACGDAQSGHTFQGGERSAHERICHLLRSGAVSSYKETRNGLLGADYSTKLSAYLALGCISARQVHEELLKFEDGKAEAYREAAGYAKGENAGTAGIRFELLWRDYMRLCTAKFGRKLFKLSGFTQDKSYDTKWKTADKAVAVRGQQPSPDKVSRLIERFNEGTTGMGLIDATQRELFLTGYTSNRARQNAASFLSKHLNIDWRYGAEWYEMLLVDYDTSSNWANWQYVAGVGNDPRGDARIFNPVKQAFDYDKDGAYVRTWVPELKDLEKPENVFQAWTTSKADLETCGLVENVMVTNPLKRIDFKLDRKPRSTRRPFPRNRGRGGGGSSGGRRGGNGRGQGPGQPDNSTEESLDDAGPKANSESKDKIQHGNGAVAPPHQPRPPTGPRGKYSNGPHGYVANGGYNGGYTGGYNGGYTGGYNGGWTGYGFRGHQQPWQPMYGSAPACPPLPSVHPSAHG
ncbi:FAD binding domain of DNA photolyase [Hirsutella rhossiliensis]|uniref:Cryptochrome DASH n=1 Tax=Hirsutella rhossiliensis TaxID=111463 RepID=A0A9P8SII0_9HYPO|nr:FAD binding domain of DNA photolyase [Hirsutella rhossiliensis]KAH0964233.1 FAD binding domain of DNA photolyase [Hirsutella rhossiliensis]